MKNTKLFTTWMCSLIAMTLLLLSSCETSKNYVNEDKIEPINYEKFTARTSIENFAPKFNYHIISDKEIEENFYKQRIPSTYSDAFLYYTRNCPELRMAFYSIMVHESGNFTVYKRKNTDGSYDLGPSHLNSNNIKNAYFRELYNPKDESHITNVYCFYMVMSLNYFRDMVDKFGNIQDAFYAYNGGQKAPKIIKSKTIPKNKERFVKNVKSYATAINNNIDKYELELNEYKEKINSDIEYGIKYVKENSYKYKNYTDVYISFNDTGSGLVINLKQITEINLLASNHRLPNTIDKFTNNIIVADRRKYNIFNLIKDESIIC